MVIIEIVVEAKVLFVIEPVVDPDRKLVAAVGLHRYSLNEIGACRRSRNKLKQIHGGGIQAFQGNLVGRKNVGVEGSVRDRNKMSSDIVCGLLTTRSLADLISGL